MRFILPIVLALAAPAAAQQEPRPLDLSQVPLSLDRIREGVQREPALKIDFLNPNIPVFRVEVEERQLELADRWRLRDTAVGKYVVPPFATWHHEFLSMTTPKAQQSISTSPFGIFGNPVYPVGVPVGDIGAALQKGISRAWQNRQRTQIRQQIQDELKQIEANQRQQQAQQAPQAQQPQAQQPQPQQTSPPQQPQQASPQQQQEQKPPQR